MNSPVDTADVRRRNLSLVLRHVAAHGPCARTELAEATGLVHASITALTAELIANGLIHEVGLASSGSRGRPRRLLELAPGRVAALAIQVTVGRLVSAATDLDGTVLWRNERAHAAAYGDPRPVAGQIGRIVHDALTAVRGQGRERMHLARVVVAVPGPVIEDDIVADSIQLGWRRVDLRALVRAEPGAGGHPLRVVNEANMAAFAEYRALMDRTGTAPRVFAYLRGSGSGIGGGLVADGAVQTGGHGMAGEFGHIPVSFDGPACKCGDRGCLVTYLGLGALLRAAGLDPGPDEADLRGPRAELDRRLRGGDPAAVRALEVGARPGHRAHRGLPGGRSRAGGTRRPSRRVVGLAGAERVAAPGRAGAVTPTDEPVISTDLLGADATVRGALRYGCETVLDDPARVPLLTPA